MIAGVKLDIFTALARGPRRCGSLAVKLNCSEAGFTDIIFRNALPPNGEAIITARKP